MGRLKTFTRRAFLVGSVAVAGGVAFGAYMVNTPHENPLLADLETGEAALTPYVRIDAEGVTLITPRADKGQGAYSVQAALIAEELDIELDQIRSIPARPRRPTGTPPLPMKAAAFMAPGRRDREQDRPYGAVIRSDEDHGHADHRRLDHGSRWLCQAAPGRCLGP
jgi:isoquinoline 1-oxidoreductase beta subunit